MKTTRRDIVEYWSQIEDECGLSVDWADAETHCWRCAEKANLDRCHIVPRALGGSEHPSNLVLLCLKCHREAPNVSDPGFMWKWLRAHAVSFYGTYWHKRAVQEFKLIYGRAPFSVIDETKIAPGSIAELSQEVIEKHIRNASVHFGEGRLNASTMAWLLFQAEQEVLRKVWPNTAFERDAPKAARPSTLR